MSTPSLSVALPWRPLQEGAWLEKTNRLLLSGLEEDDILVTLPFHLDAPGEVAPVLFVWGETSNVAVGAASVEEQELVGAQQRHSPGSQRASVGGVEDRTGRKHPAEGRWSWDPGQLRSSGGL